MDSSLYLLVTIIIAALVVTWVTRPKKKLYFCRFVKKVYVCEAEKKKKYPSLSNGMALYREGMTINFWQKVYLPFPPQLRMSVGAIAYSLKRNKKGQYVPVRFNPEKQVEHTISFNSGEIISIYWSRYDMGFCSDTGVFTCEVTPYQMSEEETINAVTLKFISEGWRVDSSISDEVQKYLKDHKTYLEKKGEAVSEEEIKEIEKIKKIADLASNDLKNFGIVGTLY